jgi:hypothetical protein
MKTFKISIIILLAIVIILFVISKIQSLIGEDHRRCLLFNKRVYVEMGGFSGPDSGSGVIYNKKREPIYFYSPNEGSWQSLNPNEAIQYLNYEDLKKCIRTIGFPHKSFNLMEWEMAHWSKQN